MINILIITTWFPNEKYINTGIFVKKLIEAQIKYSNVYITVVSPVPYFPIVNFAFIPEKFRNIAKIKYFDNKNGYFVYYPKYLKLPSPFSEKIDWYSYYKAVKRVIRKEKLKFNIIHSHGLIPDAYVATKISKLFHIPIVNHLHDSYFDEIYKKNKNKVNVIFKNSNKIIPVSQFQANLVLEYFKNYINKIEVVYNGINTQKFKLREKNIKTKKTTYNFIFVGNIDFNKGIDLLILAFNALKQLPISIDIYGKGKDSNKFENQVKLLGLKETIKFKGEIQNDLLGQKLTEYDFFILPSRFETFGIVLIEAMSCGLPVIASNITAIPEIVKNEVGILFDNCNYLSLIEAIKTAIYKKWDNNYISSHAKKFSLEKSAEHIEKIYHEIVKY